MLLMLLCYSCWLLLADAKARKLRGGMSVVWYIHAVAMADNRWPMMLPLGIIIGWGLGMRTAPSVILYKSVSNGGAFDIWKKVFLAM